MRAASAMARTRQGIAQCEVDRREMPARVEDPAERERQKRFEAADTAPGSDGAGADISDGCSSGVS
jgi:hypothetical protein